MPSIIVKMMTDGIRSSWGDRLIRFGGGVKHSKTLPATILVAALLLFGVATGGYAASFLDQGEAALRNNEPDRAKALFQASLNQNPSEGKPLLYLGIAELQLGQLSDAADTFKRGLEVASAMKDLFYYNIGNVYFMQDQNTLAEGMYSQAIQTNPNLAAAYLNRANVRMKLKSYDAAVSDYTVYLTLAPNAPQRSQIEKVIGLIKEVKAEAARKAQLAEQKKKQEAAHQQALLDSVLHSLSNASNDTTNLQAGTAPLQSSKVNLGLDEGP